MADWFNQNSLSADCSAVGVVAGLRFVLPRSGRSPLVSGTWIFTGVSVAIKNPDGTVGDRVFHLS